MKLTYEIFQVYEGTQASNNSKIAEICSSKHPPPIISEGNSLTIALDETVENDFAFTFDLKAYYTVIDNGKNKMHLEHCSHIIKWMKSSTFILIDTISIYFCSNRMWRSFHINFWSNW